MTATSTSARRNSSKAIAVVASKNVGGPAASGRLQPIGAVQHVGGDAFERAVVDRLHRR